MKEYLRQLMQVWAQFGLSQKISLMTSVVAVVSVMVGLVIWGSRPKMQLLYGQMAADDMSQVVATLESKGIEYKVGAGGASVFVPTEKVYSLRMELAGQGVPSGNAVGFEIFDETNFGISDFVQKTNYIRAIQGELARTVKQLQGVRSARVMVSMPENRLLAEASNIRPTASVFVDTGGMRISEDSVNSIRFLVANSVEGLQVDDVAVVDNHGDVLSEALRGEGGLGATSARLKYKQGLEDYYANKIEGMLMRMVGKGNVIARVSVNVSSDASTIVEERYDPTGQVVRTQTITEDNSMKDDAQPTQVAGVVADGGQSEFGQANKAVSTSKDTMKKKVIAYEISKSTKETVMGPGILQDVSAAVFIPLRQKMGTEDEVVGPDPRSQEEMNSLRRMIANMIGFQGDEEMIVQNISLKEIPFINEPLIEESGLIELPPVAYQLLDMMRNFTGIGIALLMFIVFKKALKAHKPSKSALELIETEEEVARAVKNVTPQPSADLINDLIQQKPDNVGSALKNWMVTSD